MDFSKADLIPTEKFNRILWKGMKGDKPYPALKPAAKPTAEAKDKDDDKDGSE